MKPFYISLLGLSLLAACGDTNPLGYADFGEETVDEVTDDGEIPDIEVPDGEVVDGETEDVPEGAVGLRETATPYTTQTVTLNDDNTLTVVGLPFDGNDRYIDSGIRRGPNAARPQFVAFIADPTTIDDDYDGGADGPITQDNYIAMRSESATGRTRVTVVRSGAYADHGFGGYLVERDRGATLPTEGQGNYVGNYAGLRTFDGRADIQLTDGDMLVEVDFEDLSDSGALRGTVYNRSMYESDGTRISNLPNISFVVQPYNIGSNEHIDGELRTRYVATYVDTREDALIEAPGTYSALFVGDNAEELVGTLTITTPGYMELQDVVTVDGDTFERYLVLDDVVSETRETGGYVLER